MNNSQIIIQKNGKTFIKGKEMPQVKSIFFKNTVVQINGHYYINGKELKKGKWKYTIKSVFYTLF